MIKISRKINIKSNRNKISDGVLEVWDQANLLEMEVLDAVKLAVEQFLFSGGKVEDGFVVHVAKDNSDGVLNVTVS